MKKIFAVLLIALGVVIIAFVMKFANQNDNNRNIESIVSVYLPEEAKNLSEALSEATKNIDSSKAEGALDFVKEKEAQGSLKTREGILESINEAKEEFGMEISDSISAQIADTMLELDEMGISSDILIEESDKLFREYGEDFSNHIEEALVGVAKEAAGNAAENLWDKVKNAVTGLFSGE